MNAFVYASIHIYRTLFRLCDLFNFSRTSENNFLSLPAHPKGKFIWKKIMKLLLNFKITFRNNPLINNIYRLLTKERDPKRNKNATENKKKMFTLSF